MHGVGGTALDWFKSYILNRKQFVQYNGHCSSTQCVNCGVPQGSILGSLLFFIYVNDICDVSKELEFILFAEILMSSFAIKISISLFKR